MDQNNENSRVASSIALSSRVVSSEVHAPKFKNKAFAFALLANILWGTSFLASKYTLQVWGPLSASALRFGVALIFMVILFPMLEIKINRLRSPRDVLAVFIIGVTGFGILYPLQLTGLQTISSSTSAAIMLTSPLFVILLGRIFLSESFSAKKIVAILLGMVGGTLLLNAKFNFSSGFEGMKGELLTLGASVTLAVSAIVTRKFAKQLSAGTLTFWSMFVGFILMLPFAIREPVKIYAHSDLISGIVALLYLALVCSALCFLLWNAALSLAPAKNIASSMHIKTPAAVLLGVLVAGERLSTLTLTGAIIVGAGVWLSQLSEDSRLPGIKYLRLLSSYFRIDTYYKFDPTVIVEATSVCDRSCPGCYAPNVVTKEDTENLLKTNPNLFLRPEALESQLAKIGQADAIAIRGGEPSRHPRLPELLEICARFSKEIILETHGRWIYPQTNPSLLDTCRGLKVTMKLSFDLMHGLSKTDLRLITDTLERNSVPWLVAITEKDEDDFIETRTECDWVPDSKIIFQKKVSSIADLITPKVGVIHCNGTLSSTLNSRDTFRIQKFGMAKT
jgi:drug/metabolite transporter (DMT)-like permease